MFIIGIDGSINSTGIALLEVKNYEIVDVKFFGYTTVKRDAFKTDKINLKFVGTDYKKKSIMERQDIVYDYFEDAIISRYEIDYGAIEDYAFGFAVNGGATNSIVQLGEFNGGTKRLFHINNVDLIAYSPMTVKRFATGSGNATKVHMTEAMRKQYPQFWYPEFDNMKEYDSPQADMVDAFWMGVTLLNHIKYEHLGRESMDANTVALLEYTTGKNSKSIVEHSIVESYIFRRMKTITNLMEIEELKQKQLEIMRDKKITDDEKLRLINEIGKQISSYDNNAN